MDDFTVTGQTSLDVATHPVLPSGETAHAPNPNFDATVVAGAAVENVEAMKELNGRDGEAIRTPESSSKTKASLHAVTPLVYSPSLSSRSGHHIYLKLDALQPSGSFKIRGIGATAQQAYERYGSSARLVCTSGGNAGLACATAAKTLGLSCEVYLPTSAEASVLKTLQGLGAKTVVVGDAWDDCDRAVKELMKEDSKIVYVHPFEGDDLVEGHSSLVQEIYQQMAEHPTADQNSSTKEAGNSTHSSTSASTSTVPSSNPVDIIVSATGGGGLLRGILLGLDRECQNGECPDVVSVQCHGADSFNRSMESGSLVTLDAITSGATSMGARTCSQNTMDAAKRYPGKVHTLTVPDGFAGSAAWQFENEDLQVSVSGKSDQDSRHLRGIMTEMACGAALAPVYFPERILQAIVKELSTRRSADENDQDGEPPLIRRPLNIIIEVCGGSKVDRAILDKYREKYGVDGGEKQQIRLNGRQI